MEPLYALDYFSVEGDEYHLEAPQYSVSNFRARELQSVDYSIESYRHGAEKRWYDCGGDSSWTSGGQRLFILGFHLTRSGVSLEPGQAIFRWKNELGSSYSPVVSSSIAHLRASLINSSNGASSAHVGFFPFSISKPT